MRRDTAPPQPRRQRVAPGHAGTKDTPMNGMSRRLAAASGAFSIVAVIVGGGPIDQESPAGLVLLTTSFVVFVIFIGYLHPLLRRAEGSAGWLATVALVAGTLHVATRFELLAA